MNINSFIKSILRSLYTVLLITPLVFSSIATTTVMAATDSQREDVLKNSPEHDGDNTGVCDSGSSSGSSSGTNTGTSDGAPGKIYLLGDSIGEGVKDLLGSRLKPEDGWSVDADTRVGRPLSEGISIANGSPAPLSSANYILIMLGTNPDAKNNAAGIKEMVDALRKTNTTANIFWVTVNVTRSDLIEGATKFNTDLRSSQGINIIDNTLAPDLKGLHYSDYGPLADIITYSIATDYTAQDGEDDSSTDPPADMTEEQKIASTFIVGFSNKATMEAAVKKYHFGGVFILGTKDAASAGFNKDFFTSLSNSIGKNLIVASDEEGTSIHRYSYPFDFPNARDMANKTDQEVEAIGKQVGGLLAENGVNTDLAPVLDVSLDAAGTDAGTPGRAFSNDPAVVTAKAGAFAKGLKSAGISPVYKHFPGLGSTPGNTDTGAQTSPSLDTLKQKDLKPYESLANQYGAAVMLNNAHIPGLTEAGNVAGTSPAAVNLLKNDYKFGGLITTDDLKAAGVGQPLPGAIVKSLQAGVHMPLFTYSSDADIDAAIAQVKAAGINVDSNLTKAMSFSQNSSGLPGGSACCASGSSTLVGNNNAEMVWNFLISKGFSNVQVAGIMGNLEQESNFNPTAVNSGSGAYGLAQWLGSRLTALQAFAENAGKDKSDLAVQLDFMWSELQGGYKSSTLDPILASNNLEEITRIFLERFEAPCTAGSAGCDAEMDNRLPKAITWLNRAGGGAGSGAQSTSSQCGSTSAPPDDSSAQPAAFETHGLIATINNSRTIPYITKDTNYIAGSV